MSFNRTLGQNRVDFQGKHNRCAFPHLSQMRSLTIRDIGVVTATNWGTQYVYIHFGAKARQKKARCVKTVVESLVPIENGILEKTGYLTRLQRFYSPGVRYHAAKKLQPWCYFIITINLSTPTARQTLSHRPPITRSCANCTSLYPQTCWSHPPV